MAAGNRRSAKPLILARGFAPATMPHWGAFVSRCDRRTFSRFTPAELLYNGRLTLSEPPRLVWVEYLRPKEIIGVNPPPSFRPNRDVIGFEGQQIRLLEFQRGADRRHIGHMQWKVDLGLDVLLVEDFIPNAIVNLHSKSLPPQHWSAAASP